MKTFAIAGCGHLGKIVCEAYIKGLLRDYSLIAAFSRKKADAEEDLFRQGAAAHLPDA